MLSVSSKRLWILSESACVAGHGYFLILARPSNFACRSGVAPYKCVQCCWLWQIYTLLHSVERPDTSRLWITVFFCFCPVSHQYWSQRSSHSVTRWEGPTGAYMWKLLAQGEIGWERHHSIENIPLKLSVSDVPTSSGAARFSSTPKWARTCRLSI